MLPIDTLSDAALALLQANGEDTDALLCALHLDAVKGEDMGEVFLAISADGKWIYRLNMEANDILKRPLCDYSHPYVDSALSSCRLLANYTTPEGEVYTVQIGAGTNACRNRLFVFLAVWESVARGEIPTGEEAMFTALLPKDDKKKKEKEPGAMRRMLSMIFPYKRYIIGTLIFLLGEIAADLIRPYLSGKILFDRVIVPTGEWHNLTAFFLVVGATILLATFRWLCIYWRTLIVSRCSRRMGYDLNNKLFAAMQNQSMAYFNRNRYGWLGQILGADVNTVREFYSGKIPSLLIHTLDFIGVGVMLFVLNWRLSLFILVPIPIIILIYRRAYPHLARLNIRSARVNSELGSRVNDSLIGFRVVKAFAREEDEAARLDKSLDKMLRVNLKANLFSSLLGPAVALLIYLADQAIWGVGGIYVMGGVLTYGAFSTYLGYIGMVFTPLRFFSDFAMMAANASESAARITRTLDAVPDVQEREEPTALPAVRGEIEFTGVRFHYVPNRPILRGVSFRIAAGEHIGLVGQTGCGKSTIANLLLRMYDVTGGRVRLDGFDVRDLSIATLRKSIAIVSQEVHIFYGSIAENIRFARPEATDEEVVAAAKAAGAHDFIMALSEGYNTIAGPGGRTLSGGECQRVSIARAIITQPSILILDEATAAMDNETEQRIAQALEALTRGRTTISIAHRLSTLRDCDRIMAMDGGRIVEEGTREELIEKGGIFCKLYTLQNEQLEQVLKGVTENDENA